MKKALFILLLSVAAAGCHKSDAPAPAPDGDRVSVGFALGEVSASAKPASRADAFVPEALAVGTTVRVLAFQRAQGASDADIAVDSYVAEATYVVAEEGFESDGVTPKRVLKACNVDAAGAVDAANTADPAEIRLRADKYDFYAFTPAAAIASPWTVSISHGVDHASSCTKDVAIAPNLSSGAPLYKQTVTLDMLVRKCSQISFAVDRKSENVKKVLIKSVKLTDIAPEPASATLCEALPLPALNNGSFTMQGSIFSAVDGSEYQFAGKDEVLPKSKAKFGLSMTVEFNDSGEDTVLDAPVDDMPEWAFEPNLQYCFALVLKGGSFVLTLQVLPWDTEWSYDLDLGDWPYTAIEVGEWNVSDWTTGLGGNSYPVVNNNSWTANPDWNTSLGQL